MVVSTRVHVQRMQPTCGESGDATGPLSSKYVTTYPAAHRIKQTAGQGVVAVAIGLVVVVSVIETSVVGPEKTSEKGKIIWINKYFK